MTNNKHSIASMGSHFAKPNIPPELLLLIAKYEPLSFLSVNKSTRCAAVFALVDFLRVSPRPKTSEGNFKGLSIGRWRIQTVNDSAAWESLVWLTCWASLLDDVPPLSFNDRSMLDDCVSQSSLQQLHVVPYGAPALCRLLRTPCLLTSVPFKNAVLYCHELPYYKRAPIRPRVAHLCHVIPGLCRLLPSDMLDIGGLHLPAPSDFFRFQLWRDLISMMPTPSKPRGLDPLQLFIYLQNLGEQPTNVDVAAREGFKKFAQHLLPLIPREHLVSAPHSNELLILRGEWWRTLIPL